MLYLVGFWLVVYAGTVLILAFAFLKSVPGYEVTTANMITCLVGTTVGAVGLPHLAGRVTWALFIFGGLSGGYLLIWLKTRLLPRRTKPNHL
ncbi:MAG TPA: hypothetical protein VFA85_15445 [Terriglobales bacterium]|nr:hypothetical protein [Terriglobales bacterium]